MKRLARLVVLLAFGLLIASRALALTQDPETGREEIPADRTAHDELWLVDAASQAPLAGARVHYVDLDKEQTRELYTLGLGDMVRRIESEGVLHESDARGLVRLPKPLGTGIALARHAGLIGMWWIDEQEARPWSLELRPDAPWDIYVCDPRGGPIADLRLQCLDDEGDSWMYLRTDAQGRARLEHAAWQLAQQDSESFEIVPSMLLREPVSVRLDGRVPPTEPTELFVPETGIVEVVLREPEGGPWAYENHLVWMRHAHGLRSAQSEAKQQIVNLWWGQHDQHRVHVESGLEVEAGWRAAGVREDVTGRCVGPSQADGLARIELALTPAAPVARMRVLGEDGKPLVNKLLDIRLRSYGALGGGTSNRERKTDARGFFYVPLEDRLGGSSFVLTIAQPSTPSVQAVRALTPGSESGWIDLGDIRLALAPVLAAGRVVDAEGKPLPGAKIAVRATNSPAASSSSRPSNDQARALQQARESMPDYEFHAGPSWTIRADAQGAFELRAAEVVGRVQVSLQQHSFARGPWTDGAPGRTDYRIAAPLPTAAQGRLLFPPGLSAADFDLRLHRPASSGQDPELEADGSWKAEHLEPGTWWLDVVDGRVFSWDWLARAEFELAAGESVRVPDLDLRTLRVIHIGVVDEHGEPIDATGRFEAPRSGNDSDIEARAGKARLLTRHARVDAWLRSPGRFRTGAKDVQDGHVFVLPTAGRVRVRLSSASELPPPPLVLFANLTWGEETAVFDSTRVAELPATIRGKQHVHLGLRDPRLNPDLGRVHVSVGHPKSLQFELTVPESSELIEIEVEVSADQMAEAQRRLEEL
jgi:hypothetical protein